MRLAKLFLGFLFFYLVSVSGFAQDKIYKRNGLVIESKVKEIGINTITYKRFDNQTGPDYVLRKEEIDQIIFENGAVENISERSKDRAEQKQPERVAEPVVTTPEVKPQEQPQQSQPAVVQQSTVPAEAPKKVYGNNIIAISPIQITNASVMGFGIHYERALDPKGILGFNMPFAFSVISKRSYQNGSNGNYDVNYGQFYWFYPGLKFYPGGNRKVFSYGVGPSIALGFGYVPVTNTVNGQNSYSTQDRSYYGIMINNSLNFQPTPNLTVGGEFGLGIPYNFDQYSSGNSDDDYRRVPLVQLKFFIGCRF